MDQQLKAHKGGTVTGLDAEVGATVYNGGVICEIKDCPGARTSYELVATAANSYDVPAGRGAVRRPEAQRARRSPGWLRATRGASSRFGARWASAAPTRLASPGITSGRSLAIPSIPACATCHGEYTSGWSPIVPHLAAQPSTYLATELRKWRSGERANDPLAVMARIAAQLTEEEIAAVSEYLEYLPRTHE